MKTLVVHSNGDALTLLQRDSSAFSESEFEYMVVEVLTHLYPSYICVLFGGTFSLDQVRRRPDVALIARDYSHWFVIEVELSTHSLDGHVIPQVRNFIYGTPEPDCASVLSHRLGISLERARTLVNLVPRSVAVIVDRHERDWEISLRALNCQMLVLTSYAGGRNAKAAQMDGRLSPVSENLGFGTYSSIDKAIRFPGTVRLPRGDIQLIDPDGIPSMWRVRGDRNVIWVTKVEGLPNLPEQAHVQVVKEFSGSLSLRLPQFTV